MDCSNGSVDAVRSIHKTVYKCQFPFSATSNVTSTMNDEEVMPIRSVCCKPFYDQSNINWKIIVYPMGDEEENKDYLSVHIDFNNSAISPNFTLILVDSKFKITCDAKTGPCSMLKESRFIKRSLLMDKNMGLLIDNKLTFLFEVGLSDYESTFMKNVLYSKPDNTSSFMNDYAKLLNNENYSDIRFIIDGNILYAHKNILASRCSVFAAMFKHDRMQENIENQVIITDINHEVFLEMLRFIYTGEVYNIYKIAKDLLIAADKYSLIELKTMCEKCLCRILSLENALEYFSFSDIHNAEELRCQAKQFMADNATIIVHMSNFDAYADLPKTLILEAIRAFIPEEDSSECSIPRFSNIPVDLIEDI